MKLRPSSLARFGSCWIGLLTILLAIGAMIIAANYQYPEHLSCGGELGAGFPAVFICDIKYVSPGNSWGKIDFADVYNGGIAASGFFVDFLCYVVLIWLAWFAVARFFHKGMNQQDLRWSAFIAIGYMIGFLSAFWVFQPSSLANGAY